MTAGLGRYSLAPAARHPSSSSGCTPSKLRFLLFCILLLLLPVAGLRAETPTSSDLESKIKAGYLNNFAHFVEWPSNAFASKTSPLVIGILGSSALADELTHIVSGRTVNGHPLLVRKLRPGDSLAGLHALFLGQLNRSVLADVLASAKGKPILTVTESEADFELGSMINFIIVSDRVRFEVALPAVDLGQLRVSASMLAVAYKVTPRPL